MKTVEKFSNSYILTHLLDGNNSPVARMRLFSEGIRTNNRIVEYEPITGDKGCLACGNCIDACPVVREKRRFVFTLNRRTSMSLENFVGDECRRCYACVNACPQVGKATKVYIAGFRRAERIVHASMATLIFLLATTGIFMFHYKTVIPEWQQVLLKYFHSGAGILLLTIPFIFFFLDRAHFKRAVVNSFSFGAWDLAWLKKFWAYLKNPGGNPLPDWREFNTYHKFWFVYLFCMIPVLGISGLFNLASVDGTCFSFSIHAFFALTLDILVLTHLYFKLMRRIFRDISDAKRHLLKKGNLHYPFMYDPKTK